MKSIAKYSLKAKFACVYYIAYGTPFKKKKKETPKWLIFPSHLGWVSWARILAKGNVFLIQFSRLVLDVLGQVVSFSTKTLLDGRVTMNNLALHRYSVKRRGWATRPPNIHDPFPIDWKGSVCTLKGSSPQWSSSSNPTRLVSVGNRSTSSTTPWPSLPSEERQQHILGFRNPWCFFTHLSVH